MKIAILDKSTLGADIDLLPIRALGETAEFETTACTEVEDRIKTAEVVIVNKIKLNEGNLAKAKRLKLICVAATGYDNIDTEYCAKNGIAVCNVPGYSTNSVAQVSVAMALYLVNRLGEYRSFVNSGQYTASGVANRLTPVYHELSGMTWGVVGGGGIGTRVAEIAKALGCNVIMCRRKSEGEFTLADIDTLVEKSDIISLHIPLSESTKNLINRERIEKMKQTAILVNTARGAVTDEAALAEALTAGKIGGLGIDVYSVEPFGEEHPFSGLLKNKNVCFTPHMAWGSFESRTRCVEKIAENIKCFMLNKNQNRIV
jgi:glycerate dehydrogenase